MPPRRRPDLLPKHFPRVDGAPPRAVTSLNLRHEDKRVFDALQAWWSLRAPVPLKQWDAFAVILAAALENPRIDLPDELRRDEA